MHPWGHLTQGDESLAKLSFCFFGGMLLGVTPKGPWGPSREIHQGPVQGAEAGSWERPQKQLLLLGGGEGGRPAKIIRNILVPHMVYFEEQTITLHPQMKY